MDRIAVIGIIVEETDSVECLNHLLHEYGSYIIGRMGIPYRQRNVNIISVAVDAPQDIINDIKTGINKTTGKYVEIIDRKEAIRYAIMNAEPGDVIVLAGKGHEDYQILKDKTIHFDDKEVAREAIRGKK